MILLALAMGASADYRALGTEPFWSLTVGQRRMRLDHHGLPILSARTPRSKPIADGRRYETPRMTVTIVRRTCSDGMSDRVFRDSVTVAARGHLLRGCGGPYTEPAVP